jgi:hypothetical protein
MIDTSSAPLSIYSFNKTEAPLMAGGYNKVGSAHAPSVVNVRSRKEGMASDSTKPLDQALRHDQSLLPAMSTGSTKLHVPSSTPKDRDKFAYNTPKLPELVEIIDIDAVDPQLNTNPSLDNSKLSPFKPNHKPGASLSSIDSTGRLERQLFSALGEELGNFEHQMDMTGMGPELTQALDSTTAHSDLGGTTMLNHTASEFESSIKRKRQGTLGGERDRSPMTKKERSGLAESDDQSEEVGVRMRGD